MFKVMLCVALAITAVTASTAMADPGLPGTGSGKAEKSAPAPHHGMSLHIKLNSSVSDGQDASFSLTIGKTAGQSVQYISAAIGWSYDGKAPTPYQFANLSNLSPAPAFVYASRHWIKVPGMTTGGVPYTLAGKVKVANRGTDNMGDATFFCVQATVMATYPGMPNATWYEQSNISCSQYSVR